MVTLDSAGGVGGRVHLIAAPVDLGDLVEHAWVESHVDRSVPPAPTDRIVPDGSANLLLHVMDRGGRRRLRLVGARSVGLEIDKRPRACTVGVRLRTGAAGPVFDLCGSELVDRSVPLEAIVAPQACRSVLAAPSPERAIERLFELIRGRARGNPRVDWRTRAVDRLLEGAHGLRIDDLSDRIGVPGRTLRKVLRRDLGFGAKRLARIVRIHQLVTYGRARPHATGPELAAATGFTDQPHMIREARALLGETPTRFLARGLAGDGHPDAGRFVQGGRPLPL